MEIKNKLNRLRKLAATLLLLMMAGAFLFPSHAILLAQSHPMSPASEASFDDPRLDKFPKDLLSRIDGAGAGGQLLDLIVQSDERPGPALRLLIKQRGGKIKRQFKSIKALLVELPIAELEGLAAQPGISFITPDRQITGRMDATARALGVDKLREPAASSYGGSYPPVDGSGIGIAIIDSGINEKERDDFHRQGDGGQTRITVFKDFVNNKSKAYDDYGHGTTVAGVAAGSGWASRQVDSSGTGWYPGTYGNFSGIAPGANIISLKAIDAEGTGRVSSVIEAIDFCITNKSRYNIRVMNLSIGMPVLQSYRTDPLCQAAEEAIRRGIVVVCSAGNYGHNAVVAGYDAAGKPVYQTVYGGINSPANSPSVITVGATKNPNQETLTWADKNTPPVINRNPRPVLRSDLVVASYSSRGPSLVDGIVKPDLVAPGTKIVAAASDKTTALTSTILPNSVVPATSRHADKKMYCQLTGTSFAAPTVSGTVALMLQANPNLTPRMVKAILRFTAQSLPSLAGKSPIERLITQGAGLLNSYSAVRLAQNVRPDADLAEAGEPLLKPGRTLSGLSEDMKLALYGQPGGRPEPSVFNSGFLLSDGHLLTDGFLLSDGFLLADGHLLTDGFLLADGHMLTDGSVWPDGHMLTDSYVTAFGLQASGALTCFLQGPLMAAVPAQRFFADGIIRSTGNVAGGTIFSRESLAVWGAALMNPPPPASVGAESISVLAGNDDAAIDGITLMENTSPYYPRQR